MTKPTSKLGSKTNTFKEAEEELNEGYYRIFCNFITSRKLLEILVHELITNGFNPNVPDKNGVLAINYAVREGRGDIVKILLNYGVDPNALDKDKATSLFQAITENHAEIVKILLGHGANPNIPDRHGNLPIDLALRDGNSEIVGILLDHGIDTNVLDRRGYLTLNKAIFEKGRAEIVKILLDHGANPNISDAIGDVPLDVALNEGNAEIVRILLDHGVDPNFLDRRGYLPLNKAVDSKEPDIVKILLAHGANPNIPDKKGILSLNFAIANSHAEMVNLLLNHGADPNLKTKEFPNLHCAAKNGNIDIVRALLKNNCDPTTIDGYNKTALEIAAENRNIEIVKILLEKLVEIKGQATLNESRESGSLTTAISLKKLSEVQSLSSADEIVTTFMDFASRSYIKDSFVHIKNQKKEENIKKIQDSKVQNKESLILKITEKFEEETRDIDIKLATLFIVAFYSNNKFNALTKSDKKPKSKVSVRVNEIEKFDLLDKLEEIVIESRNILFFLNESEKLLAKSNLSFFEDMKKIKAKEREEFENKKREELEKAKTKEKESITIQSEKACEELIKEEDQEKAKSKRETSLPSLSPKNSPAKTTRKDSSIKLDFQLKGYEKIRLKSLKNYLQDQCADIRTEIQKIEIKIDRINSCDTFETVHKENSFVDESDERTKLEKEETCFLELKQASEYTQEKLDKLNKEIEALNEEVRSLKIEKKTLEEEELQKLIVLNELSKEAHNEKEKSKLIKQTELEVKEQFEKFRPFFDELKNIFWIKPTEIGIYGSRVYRKFTENLLRGEFSKDIPKADFDFFCVSDTIFVCIPDEESAREYFLDIIYKFNERDPNFQVDIKREEAGLSGKKSINLNLNKKSLNLKLNAKIDGESFEFDLNFYNTSSKSCILQWQFNAERIMGVEFDGEFGLTINNCNCEDEEKTSLRDFSKKALLEKENYLFKINKKASGFLYRALNLMGIYRYFPKQAYENSQQNLKSEFEELQKTKPTKRTIFDKISESPILKKILGISECSAAVSAKSFSGPLGEKNLKQAR